MLARLRLGALNATTCGRCFCTATRGWHKKDFYAILGITPSATQVEVKHAYYRLSMKHHPDRNVGSTQAHHKFAEISEAYSVLGQFELRKKYDMGRMHHSTAHRHQPRAHQTRHTSGTGGMRRHSHTIYNFDEYYRAHYGPTLEEQIRETRKKRRGPRDQHVHPRDQHARNRTHALLLGVMAAIMIGWISSDDTKNKSSTTSKSLTR